MSNNDDNNFFPDKWDRILKKSVPDFKDLAESKSNEELEKEILKSEGFIADLEKEMHNDVKLTSLKEDLKVLSSAYNNEIKSEQAKSRYCVYLLRQRGAM